MVTTLRLAPIVTMPIKVDCDLLRAENLCPSRLLKLNASGWSDRLRTFTLLVLGVWVGGLCLFADISLPTRGRLITNASVAPQQSTKQVETMRSFCVV